MLSRSGVPGLQCTVNCVSRPYLMSKIQTDKKAQPGWFACLLVRTNAKRTLYCLYSIDFILTHKSSRHCAQHVYETSMLVCVGKLEAIALHNCQISAFFCTIYQELRVTRVKMNTPSWSHVVVIVRPDYLFCDSIIPFAWKDIIDDRGIVPYSGYKFSTLQVSLLTNTHTLEPIKLTFNVEWSSLFNFIDVH